MRTELMYQLECTSPLMDEREMGVVSRLYMGRFQNVIILLSFIGALDETLSILRASVH